jgi:flavin reductase (DIM6/NTAB) family NADH-FMN oxidoreductase RutF
MIFELSSLKPAERQYYLQHVIAPRPVCFASTISAKGEVNLSPFSFFNLFSSNPPIVVFSPARRVRDNTTKHTLENVEEVPEVVINIVTYDMVQQVSLSSCEYPRGVNEFIKAGFTEEKAHRVTPPMVAESKVKLECRVNEIKKLGTEGGAGNLVICEVLLMHIDDELLDGNKKMDQRKIRHIARLGGDWYCVVNEQNLFQVQKPNVHLGIGFDQLPDPIRRSRILTGNDLAQLANVTEIPAADPSYDDPHLKHIVQYFSLQPEELETELHRHAQLLLAKGNVAAAWQVLTFTG